jgi:hypothetical protein
MQHVLLSIFNKSYKTPEANIFVQCDVVVLY